MNKLITYIRPEEFSKIIDGENKKEYRLAYRLAFGSGLRISEIVGYRRKKKQRKNKETNKTEFFDDNSEIPSLTPEQINITEKQIRIIGGKGNKDRIVPLYLNFSKSDLNLLPLKIKRSTLQTHFKRLCMKVLGKPYHFHHLRHGFAVASIKQGVKLPFLQMALGHSRLDTTGIYTQADPEDMLRDYREAFKE